MEKKAATPLKIGQEEVYRLLISHRIAGKKIGIIYLPYLISRIFFLQNTYPQ